MLARYNEKGGRYFSRSEVLKATLTFGVLFRVQWFPLKDAPSGRVHFKLEWLTLLPSTDHLEQVCVPESLLFCFSVYTSAALATLSR